MSPVRLVKGPDDETKIEFTLAGIIAGLVYLVAQVAILTGAWYTLSSRTEAATLHASEAKSAVESKADKSLIDAKADKSEVKNLTDRLDRTESELGRAMAEIRTDVKQILREMPRIK